MWMSGRNVACLGLREFGAGGDGETRTTEKTVKAENRKTKDEKYTKRVRGRGNRPNSIRLSG